MSGEITPFIGNKVTESERSFIGEYVNNSIFTITVGVGPGFCCNNDIIVFEKGIGRDAVENEKSDVKKAGSGVGNVLRILNG
jgi:hypothetical protein